MFFGNQYMSPFGGMLGISPGGPSQTGYLNPSITAALRPGSGPGGLGAPAANTPTPVTGGGSGVGQTGGVINPNIFPAQPDANGRDVWGRRRGITGANADTMFQAFNPTQHAEGNGMNPWAYGLGAQQAQSMMGASNPWAGYFNGMAQGGVSPMGPMNAYSLPQGYHGYPGIGERLAVYRQAAADKAAANAAPPGGTSGGKDAGRGGAIAGGLAAVAGAPFAPAVGVGLGAGWLGNKLGWW